MNNIMIDIETLGSGYDAFILSIGAISFDIETGETHKAYHININILSSDAGKLKIDPGTILWWMQQSDEARSQFKNSEGSVSLTLALKGLTDFIEDVGSDSFIWAKSPSFDCVILKNAFKVCDIKLPWDFRKERDVRTILDFLPCDSEVKATNNGSHNSLSDCYHQIDQVCEVYARLKK